MEPLKSTNTERNGALDPARFWLIALCCLFVVVLAILIPRGNQVAPENTIRTNSFSKSAAARSTNSSDRLLGNRLSTTADRRSPAEIVAEKVSRFARDRRALTRAMAKRFNIAVSAEVERFYDAAEAGRWEELKASFDSLVNG